MGSPRSATIILPTLEAGPILEEVLAAIGRQDAEIDLERLAVDSGSRDGTVERLRRHGFLVHSIPRREFNHGATRDLAIGMARGEIAVLLTQDAVPADGTWLRHLLEPYVDPRVAGVYCRQIPRSDCNPILAERIRNWTAGKGEPVVQEIESEAAFERLPPLERLSRAAFDNVASSLRRSVWEKIPFGRRDFGEDVAWGKRVVLAGFRIVFEPRAAVVHSHNRSAFAEFRRLYCDHRNLNELFGIQVIPTLRETLRSARKQRALYLRMLERVSLPTADRARWTRWTRRYAFAEALGTLLGARSAAWRRRGARWFLLVDKLFRKGV